MTVQDLRVNLLDGSQQAPLQVGVLTIGVFDALHLGHRSLVGLMRERADSLPLPLRTTAVVTFSAHPKAVLQGIAPTRLLHPHLKRRILGNWSVDYLIELETDKKLLSLEADEFLELLFRRIAPEEVVVGSDFRFGKARKGTLDTIARIGRANVVPLETLMDGNLTVSATLTRRFLASGQLERAEDILGRQYSVLAEQESGDQQGRLLGSPTLNLTPPPEALPDGVYAVDIAPFSADDRDDAGFLPAVCHIGPRPTFESYERRFEVHVLDQVFEAASDLWEVRFYSKLRDVEMFSGQEELRKQIARDIDDARKAVAPGC